MAAREDQEVRDFTDRLHLHRADRTGTDVCHLLLACLGLFVSLPRSLRRSCNSRNPFLPSLYGAAFLAIILATLWVALLPICWEERGACSNAVLLACVRNMLPNTALLARIRAGQTSSRTKIMA